jgi:hypothetical protein
MAFRTKLDYSDNRQIKQFEKSHTVLSGGTSFGLTFGALTSGPNLTTTADTETYTTLASTFSGNGTTTIYNWYDPIMAIGEPYLSAITPSLSATTQLIEEPVFSGESFTIIDGNTVALLYTGVTFDITPIAFYDLGGGNYSGTVETLDLTTYSATSLDYTGRTIWVDVSGITRTERLIVTNEPQIGYVLTCYTSEGMAKWDAVTGVTISGGSILWSAGTGTYSIAAKNHNSIASGDYSVAYGNNTIASGISSHAEGGYSIAGGDYSHAEGGGATASGIYSHSEGYQTIASGGTSHAEGSSTIAGGNFSHAEGNQTTASGNTSHAEGFNTTASGEASHAEGFTTIASGNFGAHAEGGVTTAIGNFSHAEGNQTLASNTASHAEGVLTTASGLYSHAEGYNTTAIGQSSHSEGNQTLALGSNSHAGGNQSTASGTTSFVHGLNSNAGGSATIVLGSGITGATDNTTYVNKLNIKTLGTYADNAAATTAGLEVGTVYKTSTGQLMIRY